MVPIMGPKAKGKKIARFDWLVLGLCPMHGRAEFGGLDAGVARWERRWGTQVGHLVALAVGLGVNVWEKAGVRQPTLGEMT
jgi:hypothetical protein